MMAKDGKIDFRLDFNTQEFNNLEVPIEVRKFDLALVDQTLSSNSITIEPGKYIFSTVFPAGQKITQIEEISKGNNEILISPPEGVRSPHETHEEQHFLNKDFNQIGGKIKSVRETKKTYNIDETRQLIDRALDEQEIIDLCEVYFPKIYDDISVIGLLPSQRLNILIAYVFKSIERIKKLLNGIEEINPYIYDEFKVNKGLEGVVKKLDVVKETKLRFFNGDPLSGQVSRFRQISTSDFQQIGDEILEVSIPQGNKVWAQFVQPNMPPYNLALPGRCKLILTPNPDETYKVFVQLRNHEANLILRYWEEGFYDQVELLSHSQKINPERLLYRKMSDPIGASVGAYTILRFGELERLHEWTENLKNRIEWLPDGAAIRGEHLARIGKHEDALDSFLLLEERGLPFFSDGLNYALSRLRKYKNEWSGYFGSDSNSSQESDDKFSKTKTLLDSLQKFEPFVNFKKPITTFTGIDLNNPDNKIIEELPNEDFDFTF